MPKLAPRWDSHHYPKVIKLLPRSINATTTPACHRILRLILYSSKLAERTEYSLMLWRSHEYGALLQMEIQSVMVNLSVIDMHSENKINKQLSTVLRELYCKTPRALHIGHWDFSTQRQPPGTNRTWTVKVVWPSHRKILLCSQKWP